MKDPSSPVEKDGTERGRQWTLEVLVSPDSPPEDYLLSDGTREIKMPSWVFFKVLASLIMMKN